MQLPPVERKIIQGRIWKYSPAWTKTKISRIQTSARGERPW